jgi:hypothetical protein
MNNSIHSESNLPSKEQLLAETRAAIFESLAAAGVLQAAVSYCGIGDSGAPEDVSFERPDGAALDPMPVLMLRRLSRKYVDGQWHTEIVGAECSLDDALTDLAMEWVEHCHSGWENDDGASGTVVFDVQGAKVRIEHYEYRTESDYTETLV